MKRIIEKAGLEPWSKLFQNCRSTRETELFKMTGGNVKAVCSWIGNSPQVAMAHYAQLTEADMKEAAKMTVLGGAEKRVHNQVQTPDNSPRTGSHENDDSTDPADANPCLCNTNGKDARECQNKTKDVKWALLDLNQ